jgi:hypothetical protein
MTALARSFFCKRISIEQHIMVLYEVTCYDRGSRSVFLGWNVMSTEMCS